MKKFRKKPMHKDHSHRLVTRRDFLSQGLLSFGAMISLPSVLGFGIREAMAADCGGTTISGLTPFMAFDMAGGASLPGNFLVGKAGGAEDMLSSYNVLGWDPKESGALNKDFGLPMSAKYSKLLEGLIASSSVEARKNLRMGSICHFAQDDTSSNKLNAATLALRAGFRGTYVSNGIGIRDSLSGGNSASVVESASYRPSLIGSVSDVLRATNIGGASFRDFTPVKMRAMIEQSVQLSRTQKELYMGLPGGEQLGDLSKCAYEKSMDFLSGVQGLDPRLDASAQAAYQINQNTDAANMDAVAATVTMNTLKGFSGPGVWTIGGCDYHTGNQTEGDAKDREMGVAIGRALQLAFLLKRPFFFQLLTDGGCGATAGTRNWSSDSGDKCMTVMGYYHPKEAPKLRSKYQIGNFTDGQGANRMSLVGGEPMLVGYAVLANYLNICGKLDDFATYAPGIFTGAGELQSVLVFEGAVS